MAPKLQRTRVRTKNAIFLYIVGGFCILCSFDSNYRECIIVCLISLLFRKESRPHSHVSRFTIRLNAVSYVLLRFTTPHPGQLLLIPGWILLIPGWILLITGQILLIQVGHSSFPVIYSSFRLDTPHSRLDTPHYRFGIPHPPYLSSSNQLRLTVNQLRLI